MRLTIGIVFCLSLCIAGAQSFKAVIQKGHGEVIKKIAFSPDGTYLFTGSRDKSAKIWEANSGMEIRSFLGHEHTVNDLSILTDRIGTSSADGTAAVWNMLTGEMLWRSENFDEYVTSVAFSPDGKYFAVGGFMDSVLLYDANEFKPLKKIVTNPDKGVGYGVHLTFSPDGKYLAIGEDQRTTKVYATADWTLKHQFTPETGYCGGCGTLSAFDPEGNYLLKLSNGTSLSKYELASGKRTMEFGADFRDVVSADFHKVKSNYLIATQDSIYVFNQGDNLISKFSLDGEINDVIFHPIEEQIAVAIDKVVLLVDWQGNEIRRYQGILNHSSTGLDYDLGSYWEHYIAKWVKYKPARLFSDRYLFVGKTGNKARKWDISAASIKMEFLGHEKGILCFEQIDEHVLATGGGDGKIIIWDEKKGQIIKSISAHREPVFDLKISNDGSLLASSSWDGVISFWNTDTWERYKYVYNEGASAYEIAFTDNDAYLIASMLDKSLRLLEIETGKFVKEFTGHTDNVTSIQVDKNEIITSGWDGSIILWDLYSGLIKKRSKSNAPVYAARREGDKFISVGADRNISFWDQNLVKINSIEAHQAEVTGLQISGTTMMTSDVDGITKFWDLSKNEELYEHIQIGKNDWMVRTPNGYFDATDDAISNIHFVRGMDVLGASQVMDKFYVPGLVEQLFSKKSDDTSLGKAIDRSPPPVIKLNGMINEKSSATIYLKAEDQGGGIVALKLYHNGKQIPFEASVEKVRAQDNAKIYTIEVPLVAGLNEFSASATSVNHMESSRPMVTLYSDSKVPGSVCHILSVGINEYQNKDLNLNYARPDAASFSDQMKKQGEAIYSQVILHQIYDKDATKEKILAKIQALQSEVSINDVFIFYYAGHGSVIDGSFYLISTGASRLYDNTKMEAYGIEASELQNAMKEIKALKQLIIMDACQSGGSVEVLAHRGAPEEKAIAQLSRSSGIHVMASAGSDQYATEFESLGHGLFTYALLRGLSGEADGAPKDGKVTIYELKSFLDDQVPELSLKHKGSPQYPHTFSRGQDFPVVLIEE